MVDYNPNIPAGGDNLSTSQGQIQNNFLELNSQFGIDHTAFNTGSGNGDGFHKKVTLNVPLGADPTPVGTASSVYSKSVSGVAQLFFANSSGAIRLTGTTTASASGTTFLPGGIILKWGSAGTIGTPVSFSTAFPNNCFSMVVTGSSTLYTGGFVVSALSASQFTISRTSGSGSTGYYYIAIGN